MNAISRGHSNSINIQWSRLPICYRPSMIAITTFQLLAGASMMAFDSNWRSFGAMLAGAAITNLVVILSAHKKRVSTDEPTPSAESIILQTVMGTLTAVGLSFAVTLFFHLKHDITLGPASSLALSIFMSTVGVRMAAPVETWWKNRLEKKDQSKDTDTRKL